MNPNTNSDEFVTYAEHYRSCRESYSGPIVDTSHHESVYDCVHDENVFDLDSHFGDLVERVSCEASHRFDYNSGCRRYDAHIELNAISDIEGLSDLAHFLIPQLEQKIYRSHVVVHYALIQRNMPRIRMANIPLGSWMWHYDDCPDESIKLIIYLSDVSPIDGPLQLLARPNASRIRYPSSRIGPSLRDVEKIAFPLSRIPSEVVDDYINEDDGPYSLVGARGTYALFSPNQPHRGTFPTFRSRRFRDALFLVLRPSLEPREPVIQHSGVIVPPFTDKQYDLD